MKEKKLKPLHESLIDSFVKLEEDLLLRFGPNSMFIIAFRVQSEALIDLVKQTEIANEHLSLMVVRLDRFRKEFEKRHRSNPLISSDKELTLIDKNITDLTVNLTKRMSIKSSIAEKVDKN